MGKIKQGILGGFKGKVGTVIGASWNGIAYMRGLPQSVRNPKTVAQEAQRAFFRDVQDLAGQLTVEQQLFLFPTSPSGMTRRNALVKQLAEDPVITADSKSVNLAELATIGNAPTAALPKVNVTASLSNLVISWDEENDWRTAHANEYPTIFVANVTQKKIFLVHSTVVISASGEQAFNADVSIYGDASDEFSGFMLSTGAVTAPHGYGTLSVATRPERPPKKNN